MDEVVQAQVTLNVEDLSDRPKKLGIGPLEVQQRAVQLWGRSLEAEALTRAGADSTPQARGRVTRVLVEEILESTKEGR